MKQDSAKKEDYLRMELVKLMLKGDHEISVRSFDVRNNEFVEQESVCMIPKKEFVKQSVENLRAVKFVLQDIHDELTALKSRLQLTQNNPNANFTNNTEPEGNTQYYKDFTKCIKRALEVTDTTKSYTREDIERAFEQLATQADLYYKKHTGFFGGEPHYENGKIRYHISDTLKTDAPEYLRRFRSYMDKVANNTLSNGEVTLQDDDFSRAEDNLLKIADGLDMRNDIEDPENRWPTFFPGSYDADEILDAFIGHDHKKDDDHDEAEEEHEDHDDHDEAEEADHDDHDEDHDEDHDDGHHHEEGEVEYDEHVWLSLKNAKVLVNAIEGGIEEIDPANKDSYKTNADSYVAKLDELDKKYEEAVKNATNKTVVFGDRFPFRYLVDDYSIDYFAAFVGCSAESEASFETIAFLAGKIDELGLKTIFVIENSDKKIAETVKASTKSQDQSIVEINSLQSITSKDIENGVTYLGTMEKNLEALSEGLK